MKEAALLAAIYAAPDDDAPRLVYADWLQERGDPRGEFIALQFARLRATAPVSPAARAREGKLLAAHKRAWLGPLLRVVPRPLFERGFLEEAQLLFARGGRSPRSLSSDPRWSTVRTLHADPEVWAGDEDFYLHDLFRSLHEWRNCRMPIAAALLTDARPRRLATLDVADVILDGRDAPTSLGLLPAALGDGRGLPALRHLELRVGRHGGAPAAFDFLWRTPIGTRLETLTLRMWQDGLPAMRSWTESGAVPRNLRAVRFVARDRGVTLLRTAEGRLRVDSPSLF